jgi:CBS domain containing-hemolysin-like protein
MVPRVQIEALSCETKVEDAMEYYLQHTHSRIPIYVNNIDNIEKYMTVRDIIGQDAKKKLSDLQLPEVLKVPINTPIDKLLEVFQKTHKHIAILIDEYGGVAGLVSLEDVIEEVFGDIRDEKDREVDGIKKVSKNVVETSSDELFENILELFDLDLEHVGLDEKEF